MPSPQGQSNARRSPTRSAPASARGDRQRPLLLPDQPGDTSTLRACAAAVERIDVCQVPGDIPQAFDVANLRFSSFAMYRLHGFCQSGKTFKVAFMLRALSQPWEPQFVDFMNGVTRTDEWRKDANEMGEVPILDDGDRRLTQSGVILTYLASKHGAFGGRTEDDKLEVLRWLFFDNHKLTSYFASYRFMKAFGPSAPDPVVMGWLRGRLDNAFGILDKHLAGRSFIVGDSPTIADISICGYLFYPVEESGYEVAGKYGHVAAWLDRVREVPGWADPYDILPGDYIAPKW